ncbi:hypothetical protein B8V81_2317 [Paenibacillus pasadenensis]|uniref:Uncharacterized protein n=1 Tax=Paenibacillus pasadenensis TaxID=217090 RepID=A0A2N5N0N4_9BACL|nr:hypothetical protein B8V81_2317 [Paenibacillus pasadenensis]
MGMKTDRSILKRPERWNRPKPISACSGHAGDRPPVRRRGTRVLPAEGSGGPRRQAGERARLRLKRSLLQ